MPPSTEVIVSIVFGVVAAVIAAAAVIQAAIYFAHLHRGKLAWNS